MRCFLSYLQEKKGIIIISVLCVAIFATVFALYEFPLQSILYPTILCLFVVLIYNGINYTIFRKKHIFLTKTTFAPESIDTVFSNYTNQTDLDYQTIIKKVFMDNVNLSMKTSSYKQDMLDYYTLWVHQIKIPIASMDLSLQTQDSTFSRKISEDLFRIEQYVDMALQYQRLNSLKTDYLFKTYSVNKIVKEALRKFSTLFINKNINLHFSIPEIKIITDKKWFGFMVEQLLSNAIKYTKPNGEIFIYLKNGYILCIEDTGIGINSQDLPRIFEKGYTGFNGRVNKQASGLGLYLCKRISENLGQTIKINSPSEVGTIVEIELLNNQIKFD